MSLFTWFAYTLMKRKVVLRFTFLVLAITISYIIYHRISFMPGIHSHQGDGQFENISQQLGIFAFPGYCIKMPEFDLSKPKQAEYRLAELPTPPRECHVYFAVKTDDYIWQTALRKNFRANLQLELRDSTGKNLIHFSGNLSYFTACSSTRMDFIALYPPNPKISFYPDTREEYTVRIAYKADNKLKDYRGFVYLECGGSK